MNTKMIGMFLAVMLFAAPAMAVIGVTWNTPTSGQTYNNFPSNAGLVDLNFAVTDNNATVEDHNLNVTLYSNSFTVIQTLVADMNVRDGGTADYNCWLASATVGLDTYTCNITWDMPENAAMPDGTYYIDANVASEYGNVGATEIFEDVNALRQITINTRLSSAASTRALLLIISVIVAAGLAIYGVISIAAFGADVGKTAILVVAGAITIAIIAMILGAIVVMI